MNVDVNVTNTPFEVSVDVTTTPYVVNVKNGRYVPDGGTNGQVLGKASDNDYDTEWVNPSTSGGIPTGGTTNQILSKASNTDFDTQWVNAPSGSLPITAEGNLWQADALGAPVGRSTTEINQSVVPFLNSPVSLQPNLDLNAPFVYFDNFMNKGIVNPITVSDSGHSYVNLVGDGFQTQAHGLKANTIGNITGVEITGATKNQISVSAVLKNETASFRIILWKDVDNYITVYFTYVSIIVEKTIAGVTTGVTSVSWVSSFGSVVREKPQLFHISANIFSTTSFKVAISLSEVNAPVISDLSSDTAVFANSINYIGFSSNTISNFSGFCRQIKAIAI